MAHAYKSLYDYLYKTFLYKLGNIFSKIIFYLFSNKKIK